MCTGQSGRMGWSRRWPSSSTTRCPIRSRRRSCACRRAGWSAGSPSGVADRLGICANVEFPSPRRLADEAVAAASGYDAEDDPWLPERMVWPLLEVVGASLGEPFLRSLAEHLGGETRRVAPLHRHPPPGRAVRPLRAAAPGDAARLGGRARHRRGRPRAAAPTRRGRRSCGGGCASGSATRVPRSASEAACARLAADPAAADLPARLSLFGLTRLPAAHLVRAARAGDRPRRAPVPAPPVAGAVGEARRDRRRAAAARATPPPRWWRTGCSPPGAATPASCSS